MTGDKSVPEQIRDTIEASEYPELTVREVTQRTGLTEQQVYSAAGSMDCLELDQRVGVVRMPEDGGGEFVDDPEHELVTDGGVTKPEDEVERGPNGYPYAAIERCSVSQWMTGEYHVKLVREDGERVDVNLREEQMSALKDAIEDVEGDDGE